MADFDLTQVPDLLARLDVCEPCLVDTRGHVSIDPQHVIKLCRECAAAIRAIMAELGNARAAAAKNGVETVRAWLEADDQIAVAVASERESCAEVCDEAAQKTTEIGVDGNMLAYKSGCIHQALLCAVAIRIRGTP